MPIKATLIASIVFGEDVLEVLRPETTLIVIGHAIAAVFILI